MVRNFELLFLVTFHVMWKYAEARLSDVSLHGSLALESGNDIFYTVVTTWHHITNT